MNLLDYLNDSTIFNCDICNEDFPTEERYVNPHPRPSDPTECVATMWVCEGCAFEGFIPAKEVIRLIENNEPVLGRYYLFVTV